MIQRGNMFVLGKNKEHNHSRPDLKKKNYQNMVKQKYKDVLNDDVTVKTIVDEVKRGSISMSGQTLIQLVKRNKIIKKDPKDKQQIVINEEDMKYLLHCEENNEMMIFGDYEMIHLLTTCKYILMDGTFFCCPKQFYQLYIIHAVLAKELTFQILFCLLPNKTVRMYNKLLETIECLVNQFHGPFLMNQKRQAFQREVYVCTDFETAIVASLKKYKRFGLVHKGCLFHHRQCIWKFIQKNGLCDSYCGEFKEAVHMLESVAFLPDQESEIELNQLVLGMVMLMD